MNIRLDWPANSPSELVDTYEVWEQIDNGFWNVKSLVETNFIVFETPSAGKYRWRVRAHNFIGYGPFSAEAEGPDAPSAPGTVTVTLVP